MITKWLKDRTPEEREAHIKIFMAMPLKKLRHHQDIVSAGNRKLFELHTADTKSQFKQVRDNADVKWNPVWDNQRAREDDLIEAIDRKCFPQCYVGVIQK